MFSSSKTIRPRLRICITPFRLRSFTALITPIIVSRLPVHNVRTSKETFKIYSNFFIILLILISVLPVSTVTLMHPPSHLLPVLVACEDPGCRFQPKLFDICTKTHSLVYSPPPPPPVVKRRRTLCNVRACYKCFNLSHLSKTFCDDPHHSLSAC